MATGIRFGKGLREIGGTFIEVETAHAKCMFDFGFANAALLDETRSVRPGREASDLAAIGILPAADGIYDAENAARLSVRPYGDPGIGKECFFIISHMHIDHIGGLGKLHPDIPVYMTEASLTLYRRLAANGDVQGGTHENCIGVPEGLPFTVGDITVTPVAVDHDVIGACGYLIETADGKICYTGDYRFHGFHPERTEAFAARMAGEGIDLLITEGVTASFEDIDMLSLTAPLEPPVRTEYDLLEEIAACAAEAKGRLLIVNPYNRNVERLHRLSERLSACGRTLVLDPVAADYLSAFYPADDVAVYAGTGDGTGGESGLSAKGDTETAESGKHGSAVSGAAPDGKAPGGKRVTDADLRVAPGAYVLQLDYKQLYTLVDLKDVTAAYLHIDGAPLGVYDPVYGKLLRILELLGIVHRHMSVGGHAEPYYLRYMIDTIKPKVYVPLHSFRPEQVKSRAGRQVLPEAGEVLTLPLASSR